VEHGYDGVIAAELASRLSVAVTDVRAALDRGDLLTLAQERQTARRDDPPPPPSTLQEALQRIREPGLLPMVADWLRQALRDPAPPLRSFRWYEAVLRRVASGVLKVGEVIRVLTYALQARDPARYFAHSIGGLMT
jgi:hypothetical protein